jgi:hypothetical protein
MLHSPLGLRLATNAEAAAGRRDVAATPYQVQSLIAEIDLPEEGGAAWTQIGSDTVISGATANADWTIPSGARELLFEASGWSHNNGSNTTLRLLASVNGGSTYAALVFVSASVDASTPVSGIVHVVMSAQAMLANPAIGADTSAATVSPRNVIWATGIHNVVRAASQAGSMDAGTLRMFWR